MAAGGYPGLEAAAAAVEPAEEAETEMVDS
jgi:hypothetical protein